MWQRGHAGNLFAVSLKVLRPGRQAEAFHPTAPVRTALGSWGAGAGTPEPARLQAAAPSPQPRDLCLRVSSAEAWGEGRGGEAAREQRGELRVGAGPGPLSLHPWEPGQ